MNREIRKIDIQFTDPNATFSAGDVISGSVSLELGQECSVKAIKLQLQGISRVQWDERKTYTKGTSSKQSRRNVDVYLDELIILARVDGMMRAGYYNWPFIIRLPAYLPASFEGKYGRVQFWAKVAVERPWTKNDADYTTPFYVLGFLDLNTDNEAKMPVETSVETAFGQCCCRSGPVSVYMAMNRRGFVPGENLPFMVTIHNRSSRRISVRVVLSQQTTFKAEKVIRRFYTLVKGVSRDDIRARERIEWLGEIASIPAIVPSHLGGGCKSIDVRYFIKLILAASGPGRELEIPVEVVIGTKTLRRVEGALMTGTKGGAVSSQRTNMANAVYVQNQRASPRF